MEITNPITAEFLNHPNFRILLDVLLTLGAALGLTWLCMLGVRLMQTRFESIALRTQAKWDNVVALALKNTRSWFFFTWFFILGLQAAGLIQLSESIAKLPLVFVSCVQIILWGLASIHEWKKSTWADRKKTSTSSSIAAVGLLYTLAQTLLIVIVVLGGLSNLGVNIGALIAGLGIGGIAVALAAQNVLGDFLASLAIVLDKPFVVGDYIVAGKEEGEVEDIGIKTTRVRSVSGEELIFANKDLLESRIRNFKRMWRRRSAQTFPISFMTRVETLPTIPEIVKRQFDGLEKVKFDRCHCTGVKDHYYEFQLVFWVEDPRFDVMMDLQQKILFQIFREFAKNEIHLHIPIQRSEQRYVPRDEFQDRYHGINA